MDSHWIFIRLEDLTMNKYLLRYYLFQKDYRKNNDFNLDELEEYKVPFLNIHKLYYRVNHVQNKEISNNQLPINKEIMQAVNNDFDTKNALLILDKYVTKYLICRISCTKCCNYVWVGCY